jgi:hypothetical protein
MLAMLPQNQQSQKEEFRHPFLTHEILIEPVALLQFYPSQKVGKEVGLN